MDIVAYRWQALDGDSRGDPRGDPKRPDWVLNRVYTTYRFWAGAPSQSRAQLEARPLTTQPSQSSPLPGISRQPGHLHHAVWLLKRGCARGGALKGRGERDVDMARYLNLLPPLLPPLLISMAPARPATIPPALGPNGRQRRRCLSLPGPVLRFCSSSLSPSLPFLPRRWLPIRPNDSSATTHTTC